MINNHPIMIAPQDTSTPRAAAEGYLKLAQEWIRRAHQERGKDRDYMLARANQYIEMANTYALLVKDEDKDGA